ncbi:MAG TPA: host-nuclease inhibitor Gam family protein [bacterium]|nr:host-nuclease inhibitor Gam family protein [bacterium]
MTHSLADIERLTKEYAGPAEQIADLVAAMETEINTIKRAYIKKFQPLVGKAATAKASLITAVKESPTLFEKPRTYSFHGIKVGFQKQKGSIIILDQGKTIELIRKKLPEQEEPLIKEEYSLIKAALAKLSASDLKKIGVEVTADTDEVLIKSDRDKIEKFVDGLLNEKVAEELGEQP